MKQVLLVGGLSSDGQDNPSLQEFYAYMRSVLGDNYTCSATYIDKLVFTLSPDSFSAYDTANDIDLAQVDCVYIRGPKMRLLSAYAYYLGRYCVGRGIPCVNDYSLYYPGTKFAQQLLFGECEAPFLATIYSVDKRALLAQAAQTFGYPYILKTNVGSHGDSNYLVRTEQEAQDILSEEPKVDFLAQAFCPNNRDYRLLITGSTHLIFERRGSADTHINNTSKGGEAMQSDDALPSEIIDKARTISERLNLMVAGVDVMPHLETGEWYFLEVNSQPQLRTGALLEEKKARLRSLFTEIL